MSVNHFFMRNLLSVAIASVGAQSAFAQDSSSSSESSDDFSLEEVVVTAQKREQNPNDIGISISVLGGTQLKELGVASTADLAAFIPGLTYSDSGLSVPVYTLRGVGFNEQSVQSTATVGLYNDQVAVPFPIMSAGLTMDMERVEVLKGPQGTVFGRNSTGGTINNVVNKPTEEYEASLTLGYGRFDASDVSGVVNVPFSDTVGLRVAARQVKSDEGWQESVSRDETLGVDDKLALRALLSIQPSDSLDVLLSYNYWQDKSDTQAPQYLTRKTQNLASAGPTDATAVRYFLYDTEYAAIPQFGQDNIQAADWVGSGLNARTPELKNDMSNNSFAITVNADLTDEITLTSLTSYSEFESVGGYDNSGWGGLPIRDVGAPFVRGDGEVFVPQDLIDDLVRANYDQYDWIGGTAFVNDSDIEAFSQELRLSGGTDMFNWLVGVSYSEDTVNSFTTQMIDFASQGNGYGFGLQTVENPTVQEGENWGVFAHTEWTLTDRINLTAGIRYDEDEKSYEGCSQDNGDGEAARLLSILGDGFVEAIINGNPSFGPGDCVMTFQGEPLLDNGGIYADTLSEDSLSWKLGLDYDLSDDVLLYASYSRGFKAGSFPTLTTNSAESLLPVVQERLDAYEVGMKATLADGRMQLNTAAFYYDYKDKQLFTKVLNDLAGVVNSLTNIPDTTVYGAEFDVTWYPIDNLFVSLAATYVETEVKEFRGYNQVGLDADFSGSEFPLAPKFQSSMMVGYDFSVTESEDIYISVNAQYSDKSYGDYAVKEVLDNNGNPGGSYVNVLAQNGVAVGDTNVGVAPEFVMPSTFFVGAQVGIRSKEDTWDLSLWGRNLTNEYQLNNVRRSSDQVIGYTGRPRTYGVTFGYNF